MNRKVLNFLLPIIALIFVVCVSLSNKIFDILILLLILSVIQSILINKKNINNYYDTFYKYNNISSIVTIFVCLLHFIILFLDKSVDIVFSYQLFVYVKIIYFILNVYLIYKFKKYSSIK